MAKVHPRFTVPLTGLLLTAIMTGVISCVSTLLALGPTSAFIQRWPVAWGVSWLIAFPTVLVVLPFVQRVVRRLVASP